MAVISLRRRKWPVRGRKRPETGLSAAAGGSLIWAQSPKFCAVSAGVGRAIRECLNWGDWRRERNCRRTLSASIFNDLLTTRILVGCCLKNPGTCCAAASIRLPGGAGARLQRSHRAPAGTQQVRARKRCRRWCCSAPNAALDHRHAPSLYFQTGLPKIHLVLVGERARSGTGGTAQQRAGDRMIEQRPPTPPAAAPMAPPDSARSWVLVPHALKTRSDMVAAKAMRFIIRLLCDRGMSRGRNASRRLSKIIHGN